MKTMLTEIFRMQNELNQKIGRDTIGADEITRHNWAFEYLFAAKVEIGELIDCFDLYTGKLILVNNASIELIDVFHFVVSACHLVGITVDDVLFIEPLDNCSFTTTARFSVIVGFDRICEKLITDNIDWKWWSKTVKEDPSRQFKAIFDINKLKSDIINLFEQMVIVATILGLSYDDIFQVYQAKWKKNFDRQDNDYDVRTKTEHDNLEIEKNLDRILQGSADIMINYLKAPSVRTADDITPLLLKAPDDRLLCDNIIRMGVIANLFDLSYDKRIAGLDVTSVVDNSVHIRNVYLKFSDHTEIRVPVNLEELGYFSADIAHGINNLRHINQKYRCQLNNTVEDIYGDAATIFKVLPKEATFYVDFTISGNINIKTSDIFVNGCVDNVNLSTVDQSIDNQQIVELISSMMITQSIELIGYDLCDNVRHTLTTNDIIQSCSGRMAGDINESSDDKIKMMEPVRSE